MITILTSKNLKLEYANRDIRDISMNNFNIEHRLIYGSGLLVYTDKDLFKIFKSRYYYMYNNTTIYEYRLLSTIIDLHLNDEKKEDIDEISRIYALRTLSRYDDQKEIFIENNEKASYGQLVKSIHGVPSIAINESYCVQQSLRSNEMIYIVESIDYSLKWNNTYNLPLPSKKEIEKHVDIFEKNKLNTI